MEDSGGGGGEGGVGVDVGGVECVGCGEDGRVFFVAPGPSLTNTLTPQSCSQMHRLNVSINLLTSQTQLQ